MMIVATDVTQPNNQERTCRSMRETVVSLTESRCHRSDGHETKEDILCGDEECVV